MDFNLFTYTFENLNNLKFNELQKLSSHFRVNKRWAKKREIIEKLLLLRDQEIEKKQLPSISEKSAASEENIHWIDANKAFQTLELDQNPDENVRRLTYNVTTSDLEASDRRLTYNLNKEENLMTDITTSSNIDRRLTYNADDLLHSAKDLQVVSDTLNTEKKLGQCKNQYPKHDNQINSDAESNFMKNSEMQVETKNKKNISSNSEKNKFTKVKMLTIPYTRGLNSTKSRVKDSSKLEKCSITKKTDIKQIDAIVSSQANDFKTQDISLSNSLLPEKTILQSPEKKLLENETMELESKSIQRNMPNVLPRRKSKTEDNVLVKNLKSNKNLKFYSPREGDDKKLKRFSRPSQVPDLDLNHKSKIPKAKPAVPKQKIISATKMPNFSKIHQRRFEQMDSLIDYKRKKEERAKKLFGIPQPGIPIKVSKGDVSNVFQFRSSNNGKENELNKTEIILEKEIINNIKEKKGNQLNRTRSTLIKRDTINNKGSREKLNRKDILSRAGSNPDIVNNLKEQNRRLIQGVRTNKRFELQMKFRQL